jgi:hypothetical protein
MQAKGTAVISKGQRLVVGRRLALIWLFPLFEVFQIALTLPVRGVLLGGFDLLVAEWLTAARCRGTAVAQCVEQQRSVIAANTSCERAPIINLNDGPVAEFAADAE